MQEPSEILALAYKIAIQDIHKPIIKNETIVSDISFVAKNLSNRAGVRLLMACLLAKIHNNKVDPRKPYTEIGTPDSFSGRTYDEQYISQFIVTYDLPCNPTTAFLTPALRNINGPLTLDRDLVGRPAKLYQSALKLLDMANNENYKAIDLLSEVIRHLLLYKNERHDRIKALLDSLKTNDGTTLLSSEDIVLLFQQHLNCRGASRLPVLMVAAAYKAARDYLKEQCLPLQSHTAADEQTGAMGDLEISLIDEEKIVTVFEMKNRRVDRGDVDRALQKLNSLDSRIDNYIFITTEPIEDRVQEYAKSIYDRTNGIEFIILDCMSFIKYFLHIFHRIRIQVLNEYQNYVLSEHDSAVSHELKEAFLALRQVAESH